MTNGNSFGSGWNFNSTTHTLMLTDAHITTGHAVDEQTYGIYCKGSDSLNIILVGSNSVVGNQEFTAGIECEGDVNISGNGSLIASGTNRGIATEGSITIASGTVNASATLSFDPGDDYLAGILCYQNVEISGGTVTASSAGLSGILCFYGNVEISGGTVTASSGGAAGIYAFMGDLVISGGSVTASGPEAAIGAGGAITIDEGLRV